MQRMAIMLIGSLALLSACAPKEGIEVRDAWVRSAAQGENGAVYLIIHNYSETADALIGASTEDAAVVELHESKVVNDVMQMQMLSSVPLAPGTSVEFAPGGLHIMLVDLARALETGDTIEVTLQFQNAPDITLNIPVQIGPDHSDHND
jgi:copper(I)-binding protein